MSLLQICLTAAAILPQGLGRRARRPATVRRGGASAQQAVGDARRDGVLGSDPYGLWALNEFLSSGSLSHR